VNNLYNKEIVGKLEMEITKLKEEIEELNEEKDNLALNINVLESNISDKTNENMLLEKDIEEKDYKIKDDLRLINELKTEKDKLMLKLKEYKDIEELNLSQIKILKEHIKTLEKQQNDIIDPNTNKRHIKKKELKKKINELEIEKISLKTQLEKELNYNIQLKKEVNIKTEQIDILNKKINKLKGEEEDNIYTLNNKTKTIDNNSNFIRSKTNEEYKKINIKKIISKSPNKIKRRNNNILNKEYKTDKRLDLYKINETDLNSLPKDDLKTEN
jgi:chromosome segregation ATPase